MDNAEANIAQPQEIPDLVRVINRASMIESLMNHLIATYCAPREYAQFFMSEIVLNTSVMPLGVKAKVVMAVAQTLDFKLDTELCVKKSLYETLSRITRLMLIKWSCSGGIRRPTQLPVVMATRLVWGDCNGQETRGV